MITARLLKQGMSSPSSSSSSRLAAITSRAATSLVTSNSFSTTSTKLKNPKTNVVIVDGIRLPFAQTTTIYQDQLAVDLQRLAYQGLITKTALDKKDVDYVMAGTVIQEVRTSNLAREAAINAGFPASIGAHTVAMVSVLCL